MSALSRLFTEHPDTVNETYWQHFASSMGFGARMVWGGLVCFVHAFIPGVCCTRGSEMIGELHERMITNRKRLADSQPGAMPVRRAA